MNRVIKFRAWIYKNDDISKGIMTLNPQLDGYNSDYTADINEELEKNQNGIELFPINGKKQIKKTIYMQFTGLHDKNGKEIYEGDIVEIYGINLAGADHTNKVIEKGVCKWDLEECIFHINGTVFGLNHSFGAKYKVIGNIYENKELLN